MERPAASTSQMGRLETEWLASGANLAALTDLSGTWKMPLAMRSIPPSMHALTEMANSHNPKPASS
jgi:hypothetical protein